MKLGSTPTHVRVALCVLLVGALSYFARGTDPEVFRWLDAAGAGAVSRALHDARVCCSATVHLPSWFLGAFADFAYAFALGAWFSRSSFRTRSLAFVFAVGHELAQGARLVPGTFDPWDVLVLTIAFLSASALLGGASLSLRCDSWRERLEPRAWK